VLGGDMCVGGALVKACIFHNKNARLLNCTVVFSLYFCVLLYYPTLVDGCNTYYVKNRK